MARDPRDILQDFARDATPRSGPSVPNMGGITADKPQPFDRQPATPAPATNTAGRPPVAQPVPQTPTPMAGVGGIAMLGDIPSVTDLPLLVSGLLRGRGRTLIK